MKAWMRISRACRWVSGFTQLLASNSWARREASTSVAADRELEVAFDPNGPSFLRRGVFSCYRPVDVIFNLHTVHTPAGIAHTAAAFQRLIDMVIARGGSYFLTYHRWARPDQVAACYPQFSDFIAAKRRHDPDERFQSDWYRHYAIPLG
jgi:hypothetical protein